MPRPIITISSPCHEGWAAMAPAAQGRHCSACNKVVVDFTRMTDTELLAWLRHPAAPTCGRFRPDQLHRPLVAVLTAAPRWRQWLGAGLAVLGIGVAGPTTAQVTPVAQVAQQSATDSVVSTSTVPKRLVLPSRLIRGRVTDAQTGEGLPGVTVSVQGTRAGVSTSLEGSFEIFVPEALTDQQVITFFAVGYIEEEQTIGALLAQNGLATVHLSADVKGGIGFYPVYSPRGLWQRLTQPFRR